MPVPVDCKTAVFFANASDGPYSNERSGAREKTARETVLLSIIKDEYEQCQVCSDV